MDQFNQIVDYFGQHAQGLNVLYTLLGGIIAGSLFFAKPLFNYLFARDVKKDEGKQTIVTVNTLDINAIKELLAVPMSKSEVVSQRTPEPVAAENQNRTITEGEVLTAAATLSKFRNLLRPAKLLSPEVFPDGMRVLKYDPEKLLVIALPSSIKQKAFLAAFSIVHWTLFPYLAGAWLSRLLIGSPGSWIGGLIGVAIGIYYWARLTRDGPYIKINFQKMTYDLITVAGVTWHKGFPTVEIRSTYEDNHWLTTVLIADQVAARSLSTSTQKDAEMKLELFVTALNWRLGNRISIAEGVFIEPPKTIPAGAGTGPS